MPIIEKKKKIIIMIIIMYNNCIQLTLYGYDMIAIIAVWPGSG